MIRAEQLAEGAQEVQSPNRPVRPVVSVILPTYRRYRDGRLESAVDSVLAQTMDDFELIVVDDGSTDGTSEYVGSLVERDPRVVHLRHDENCGLPALRCNEGLDVARGTYVAFQFDDDTWHARALERLVAAADAHAGEAVAVGQCEYRHPDGVLILPGCPVDAGRLGAGNYIANNAVLVPRRVLAIAGYYDCHLALRRVADWDLWCRLIRYVPFVTIDEVTSTVHASLDGSIGSTVPLDQVFSQLFRATDRDARLRPGSWRQQEVDAVRIGDVELDPMLRDRVWQAHILPYHRRWHGLRPQLPLAPTEPPGTSRRFGYVRTERSAPALIKAMADTLVGSAGHCVLQAYVLPADGVDEGLEGLIVDASVARQGLASVAKAAARGTAIAVVDGGDDLGGRAVRALCRIADVVWLAGASRWPRTVRMEVDGFAGSAQPVEACEAALLTLRFHALTRHRRRGNGRPRVGLALGDGCGPDEWTQAALRTDVVRSFGAEPVLIGTIPSEVAEALRRRGVKTMPSPQTRRAAVRLLRALSPVVVDATGPAPAFTAACDDRRVPVAGAPLPLPLGVADPAWLDNTIALAPGDGTPPLRVVVVTHGADAGADVALVKSALERAGLGDRLVEIVAPWNRLPAGFTARDVLLEPPRTLGPSSVVAQALALGGLVVTGRDTTPGISRYDTWTPDEVGWALTRLAQISGCGADALRTRGSQAARAELDPDRVRNVMLSAYVRALEGVAEPARHTAPSPAAVRYRLVVLARSFARRAADRVRRRLVRAVRRR